MPESMCAVGDVELCFETFGDEREPALLLVCGLGAQMVWWRDDFCGDLADRGFHVIRYDNRDVGRSSRIRAPQPSRRQLLRRDPRSIPYTLADMAADGIGLMDHLGVDRAHVVGASMGGMIGQTMAARHPARVASLVSIMSNTGSLRSGMPALSLYSWLFDRLPEDREAYVEARLRSFRRLASPAFESDEEELRALAERAYDRMAVPAAPMRQLAAVLASRNRAAMLRSIRAPTLVVHGTADKLVSPSGGRATARAIPGARLLMIEGMGHEVPRAVWPRLMDAIADNAARSRTPASPARSA